MYSSDGTSEAFARPASRRAWTRSPPMMKSHAELEARHQEIEEAIDRPTPSA